MQGFEHKLPADTEQDELIRLVEKLNADPAVDGILVQLPLPDALDDRTVVERIAPDKDVDGLTPLSTGRLALGLPGLVPCTPLGCLMLLKETLGSLSGLEAVVIGRSILVGKPTAQLLLAESCTVTVAHSRTRDLVQVVRRADIVVAAAGRAEMVRREWIKPGATVIDVGINRVPPAPGEDKARIVGDVDFAGVGAVAGAITPVPGGVGPMTIAVLLRNTLIAAERREGLDPGEI
jgi:methylenetetrahydrofolate dehydrogenase (NADP+)/methenyltetrahydrofolate cyclohydrolase